MSMRRGLEFAPMSRGFSPRGLWFAEASQEPARLGSTTCGRQADAGESFHKRPTSQPGAFTTPALLAMLSSAPRDMNAKACEKRAAKVSADVTKPPWPAGSAEVAVRRLEGEKFFWHSGGNPYNEVQVHFNSARLDMSLVRDVLNKKGTGVTTLDLGATAHDAAEMMHRNHIGSVVIVDDGKIAGIFTERDLLNRVVAPGLDPAATPVRDVMTTKLAVCARDTTIEECRGVMTRSKLRHLPVVENGDLIGIISSGDILSRELVDQEETIRYLHEYMHGSG